MIENADDICSRLENTRSLKFREHLLWDFEPVVIDGFKKIKPVEKGKKYMSILLFRKHIYDFNLILF